MEKLRKIYNFINSKINEFNEKKTYFFNHRFKKYIVNYVVEGNRLKVYSNIGNYRYIEDSESNRKKLDHAIVKNKIAIQNKIDEYDKNSSERVTVLIICLILLTGAGILIPLTFFIGSYLLFLLSIITFSFAVLSCSYKVLDYYVLVKEIKNLKKITGYKKEYELELSDIKLNILKSHE